jgi:16S rRNA processing protein RimM
MPAKPWMPIGQVVGAHGINGAVKVHFYDDRQRTLSPGDTLHLSARSGTRTDYTIAWARPHKRNYLVGLEGIQDRDRAQALKDARVVVPRSEMPDLEDDTFYWVDLIGLDVYTVADRYLGQITSIIPTGSNDVYVVKNADTETLVPALKTVVLMVDLKTNIMRVDLPEGL